MLHALALCARPATVVMKFAPSHQHKDWTQTVAIIAEKTECLSVVWVIRQLQSFFCFQLGSAGARHRAGPLLEHISNDSGSAISFLLFFRDSFLSLPDTPPVHNDVLWTNVCLSSSPMLCSAVKPSLWDFSESGALWGSGSHRNSSSYLTLRFYMIHKEHYRDRFSLVGKVFRSNSLSQRDRRQLSL